MPNGLAFTYSDELTSIDCPNCGVVFAVPGTLERDLRNSHRSFFCPNGHSLSFKDKTEAEKLRDELAREKQRREMAEREAGHEARRAVKAEKKTGESSPVTFQNKLPDARTDALRTKTVRQCVLGAFQHEALESIFVDGERAFDPHKARWYSNLVADWRCVP